MTQVAHWTTLQNSLPQYSRLFSIWYRHKAVPSPTFLVDLLHLEAAQNGVPVPEHTWFFHACILVLAVPPPRTPLSALKKEVKSTGSLP